MPAKIEETMGSHFAGSRVRLRALEPSDWETHFRWRLDSDLGSLMDAVRFPSSTLLVREWVEAQSRKGPDRDEFLFCIEQIDVTPMGTPVGTLITHTTNPRCGTFMYGLWVDAEYRRRGYASEAIALTLRYYFEECRYQKVNVEIHEFNTPSIRLHEQLGFVKEGRLRRMIYTGGRFYDALLYGMTREELAERDMLARPAV
jgi:RimJ/RimL family protein N-acetyltransferase